VSRLEIAILALAWIGTIYAGISRKVTLSKIRFSEKEDGSRYFWQGYAWLTLLLVAGSLVVALN
jgi:hypothetical protein